MSKFRTGDIVLIAHVPYSNQLQTKLRPAVIVSATSFNASQADVICVAITSQVRSGTPYQVEINDTSPHFAPTGLRKTSAVKCAAIFAYESSGILRKLGTLPEPILTQVKVILRTVLDL